VVISPDLEKRLLADQLDTSYACWPGISISGKNQYQNISVGAVQALAYMDQQRRTQAHRRYVLGLALNEDEIGLLRADGVGTERRTVDKSSATGVVEVVQLALGLVVADDAVLGAHPAFELVERVAPSASFTEATTNKTDATENLKPGEVGAQTKYVHSDNPQTSQTVSPYRSYPGPRRTGHFPVRSLSGQVLSPSLQDGPTSSPQTSPTDPEQYRFPEALFVMLFNEDIHLPVSARNKDNKGTTRYYLHYLADSRGSLVGRCTRVWCACKETSWDDEAVHPDDRLQAPTDARVYVGPYALKLQNIDMTTEAYQKDIVTTLMDKCDEEGAKYVLLPETYVTRSICLFLCKLGSC
jgi:hypothetical protein